MQHIILYASNTVPGAFTLRFLRKFLKLNAKNTTKLVNSPQGYDFFASSVTFTVLEKISSRKFHLSSPTIIKLDDDHRVIKNKVNSQPPSPLQVRLILKNGDNVNKLKIILSYVTCVFRQKNNVKCHVLVQNI